MIVQNLVLLLKHPPLKTNNKLFIPTFKNIYQFDGESINIIENFPDALGQLYISSHSDNLYCIDSNKQNLKSSI